MKNIDYYAGTFCSACAYYDCGSDKESCEKCRPTFGGVCPCMQPLKNVDKPCEYFELRLPKQFIFDKIKQGYHAYLIGKYGEESEKREFTELMSCNLELINKPNLTRLETRKALEATIKFAFYNLGEMENEN